MTKKQEKEATFKAIYDKAHEAGLAAGKGNKPVPMIVGSPSTPFGNDIDPKQPTYFVEDGVCGFAWIVIKPGTAPFARWVKKAELGGNHYYGGISIWVHEFGQSMQRKEAYAEAFAKVLVENGINAYADSRMD